MSASRRAMSTVAFEARNSGIQPAPGAQTAPMPRASRRAVHEPAVMRTRGALRAPLPQRASRAATARSPSASSSSARPSLVSA